VNLKANHVGISVADLDRAIAFYCRGLGMSVVERSEFSGEQYERILKLPGANGSTAMLCAGDLQVELFEFAYPVPRASANDRPICDHGIMHFCVEVDDIGAAYERLKGAGAVFHCPPIEFVGVGMATYGRDPDGNVFEIFEPVRPS
jgi:catechol 2,3-dioxygenase-like lactoylglutathione lyase family enzyme